MQNKTYGFKDLIAAFINRRVYTKMKNMETVREYYDGLYKELSRQLNVDLQVISIQGDSIRE